MASFRKSFKVAPGTKITISRRGASISAGPKGLRHSVNTRGEVYRTTSIPGTGIYNRERLNPSSGSHQEPQPSAVIDRLEQSVQRDEQRIANLSDDERNSQRKTLSVIAGISTIIGALLFVGGWRFFGAIIAVLGVAQFFGIRKKYK